jgi:hypothetical protein
MDLSGENNLLGINNKDSRKKIKNKFPLAHICPAE